jgi:hypothetical protein
MEAFINANFSFGLGSTIGFVAAFVVLNLGLVIFLGSKHIVARAFAFMCFTTVTWTVLTSFVAASLKGAVVGNFLERLAFALGLCTVFSLSYVCFVHATKKRNKPLEVFYFFVAIVMMRIIMNTNYVFLEGLWRSSVSWAGVQVWGCAEGPFAFIYYIFYGGSLLAGVIVLYIKAMKEYVVIKKNSLMNMIFIVLVGIIPVTVTSIILPSFGIFQYDWIGGFFCVFWVSLTSYLLLKKEQNEQIFPVNIVKTELIVIAMIFLFGIAMFV